MHLRDAVTGAVLTARHRRLTQRQPVEDPVRGRPVPRGGAGNLGEFRLGARRPLGPGAKRHMLGEYVYAVVVMDPATASIAGAGDASAGNDASDSGSGPSDAGAD